MDIAICVVLVVVWINVGILGLHQMNKVASDPIMEQPVWLRWGTILLMPLLYLIWERHLFLPASRNNINSDIE